MQVYTKEQLGAMVDECFKNLCSSHSLFGLGRYILIFVGINTIISTLQRTHAYIHAHKHICNPKPFFLIGFGETFHNNVLKLIIRDLNLLLNVRVEFVLKRRMWALTFKQMCFLPIMYMIKSLVFHAIKTMLK